MDVERRSHGTTGTVGAGGGWVPVQPDELEDMENFESCDVSPTDLMKIRAWRGNNIDLSGLESCRKEMVTKMLNSTHAMGRLLTKLDKALKDSSRIMSFNLKYSITSLPSNQTAKADSMQYDPFTQTFSAIIKINPTYVQQGTDISISQSILHETIHAYLTFILKRLTFGATLPQIQALGYPGVFDAYTDSLIGRNQSYLIGVDTSKQYQHNYMANHLLNFFANSLEEYDDDRINDEEYYWYMAWSGLQLSQPWLHYWPTYPNATNWQTPTNPATNDDDKEGFSYALTADRLINIHNALNSERQCSIDARGKKPASSGSGNCYE